MTIEGLVADTELLKRVLEHYKYRLENFSDHQKIRQLMSGPFRRYLTFGQSKTLLSEALSELTKVPITANLNSPKYNDLIRSAANQYLKDLELVRTKCSEELPDTNLQELERDIELMKEHLR